MSIKTERLRNKGEEWEGRGEVELGGQIRGLAEEIEYAEAGEGLRGLPRELKRKLERACERINEAGSATRAYERTQEAKSRWKETQKLADDEEWMAIKKFWQRIKEARKHTEELEGLTKEILITIVSKPQLLVSSVA